MNTVRIKSKLRKWARVYTEKTWEDFFRGFYQRPLNVIQPLVFVCGSCDCVLYAANICCRFIKIWRVIYEKLKTYKVHAHTYWNVVGLIDHQCAVLFVPEFDQAKRLHWRRQEMQRCEVVRKSGWVYEKLNHAMTNHSSKNWLLMEILPTKQARILPGLLCEK